MTFTLVKPCKTWIAEPCKTSRNLAKSPTVKSCETLWNVAKLYLRNKRNFAAKFCPKRAKPYLRNFAKLKYSCKTMFAKIEKRHALSTGKKLRNHDLRNSICETSRKVYSLLAALPWLWLRPESPFPQRLCQLQLHCWLKCTYCSKFLLKSKWLDWLDVPKEDV